MILEAAELYGWFGPNVLNEAFKYLFDSLDSSIFVNFMLYPMREILGLFLYIEDEGHFSPMHEMQVYYFFIVMYPFIWLYSELFTWYHISIAPWMLFWLAIEPKLLIKGHRADGTGIPQDNYAYIFAQVDAVTSIMYGDFRYLYYGKDSYQIGFLSILNHFLFNIVALFIIPLASEPITLWLVISSFALMVIYFYADVID